MAAQKTDLQGLLEVLLPEIRETRNITQETSTSLARMEERLDQVVISQAKVAEAIFGNGKPGIKKDVDMLMARRQKEDAEKQKERDEFRKFRWGIIAAIGTAVFDIILRLFA